MAPVTLLRAEDLTSGSGVILMQNGEQTLPVHDAALQAEVERLTTNLHQSSIVKFINFAVNVREPSTLVPYFIYSGGFVIMAVCIAYFSGQRQQRKGDDDDSDTDGEEDRAAAKESEASETLPAKGGSSVGSPQRPARTRHSGNRGSSIAAPQGLSQAMRWWLGALVISSWLHLGLRSTLEILHGQFPMPFGVSCQLCDAASYSLAYVVEVAKSEFGGSHNRRQLAARLDILAGGLSITASFLAAVYTMIVVAEQLGKKGHLGGFGRHGRGAETGFVHMGPALLLCIITRAALDLALLAMYQSLAPASRTVFSLPTWLLPWEVASDGASIGFWVPRRKPTSKWMSEREDVRKDLSLWDQVVLQWKLRCSQSPVACAPSKVSDGNVTGKFEMDNLNLSGILLHLFCSALRGMIVLFGGALLGLGILKEAARVDAVCSLLIGSCVTGAVLVVFHTLLMKLARPRL